MQVSNVSFKKQLIANASILFCGEKEPVRIYKLNKKEDDTYFCKLFYNEDWKNAKYTYFLDRNIKVPFAKNFLKRIRPKFYAIEDLKDNTLCLCQVDDFSLKKQNIEFLEVPKTISEYREGVKKYLGETMLSFLAKNQKRSSFPKEIIVDYPVSGAKEFYLKSNFVFYDEEKKRSMYLPKENVDVLIKQNEEHVRSQIEFIEDKKGCENK